MSPGLRAVLLGLAAMPAAGLLLAALAPTGWLPARLALHWAPHLAVLTLPLWCWIGRRPLPGIVLAVLVWMALWPHLLHAWGPHAPRPGALAATAAVANLHEYSREHGAALRALDADLVVLIESLPGDRDLLRNDPRWPYQRWVQPQRYSGIALLSRWPMRAAELDLLHGPAIDARIEAPWGPLRVIGLHARTPRSPRDQRWHDEQIALLARSAAREPGPLLVLGDCNASAADPSLAGLRVVGLLPPPGGSATWPAAFGPLGIGIDQVFARDLALDPATAFPLSDSDHRGLRVRFGPR